MFKGLLYKTVIITIIFIIGMVGIRYFSFITILSKDITRLRKYDVELFLSNKQSECKKLNECQLISGDIIIRRYITSRTWLIDKIAHPFFTHSAIYLGNNQIAEAVGTEKDSKDDIQVGDIRKSDWLDSDIESWVIIRPKYSETNLKEVLTDAVNIAEDPDYKFGLPDGGNKRTSCADLIYSELIKYKVIVDTHVPQIVSPDYLFMKTVMQKPNEFKVVGFGGLSI